MGTLPAVSFRRRALVPEKAGGEWDRIFVESIDCARTLLMQGRPAGGSYLVMVSSACSGEGKTTLASCLTASLARAGCRTLLVDCDLRNPCLHRLLNEKRTPGICELLSNTSSIDEAVRQTPIDRFDLLPAGQYSAESAAALAQGKLQGIFQQLKERYDFIVVDSSPLLAVPDALMIGQGADGVVFSIQAGVSAAHHVYEAHKRLGDLGIPFIGVVLSGVRDKTLYTHNREYLGKTNQ
jgi:polysaccharide biosynthesis transport protein